MKLSEFSAKLEEGISVAVSNSKSIDWYLTYTDCILYGYNCRFYSLHDNFTEIINNPTVVRAHTAYNIIIINIEDGIRVVVNDLTHGRITIFNEKLTTKNEYKNKETCKKIINFIRREINHAKK